MTQKPSKPPVNPSRLLDIAADLLFVCQDTAVLDDWVVALEARYKQLTSLASALENRVPLAPSQRRLGRVLWYKYVARRRITKHLREIWKETEFMPDRIGLLVRYFILNLHFIAKSINLLHNQMWPLAREFNEYANSTNLAIRFEVPDELRNIHDLANKMEEILRPARDSIAHPFRTKLGRGSADRPATLAELYLVYGIEMSRDELVGTFRKFQKATEAANLYLGRMNLTVTAPAFYKWRDECEPSRSW